MEVQQSTEVTTMVEAQRRAMEMESHKSETIEKRRCANLNRPTLLEKGIKIPNPN